MESRLGNSQTPGTLASHHNGIRAHPDHNGFVLSRRVFQVRRDLVQISGNVHHSARARAVQEATRFLPLTPDQLKVLLEVTLSFYYAGYQLVWPGLLVDVLYGKWLESGRPWKVSEELAAELLLAGTP